VQNAMTGPDTSLLGGGHTPDLLSDRQRFGWQQAVTATDRRRALALGP